MYTFKVYTETAAVKRRVLLSRTAEKQLRKAPRHVAAKLLEWIDGVEEEGLEETRRIPGYHDEPLRGDRKGQRSIRLSGSWRAVYVMIGWQNVQGIRIEEVTNHDY